MGLFDRFNVEASEQAYTIAAQEAKIVDLEGEVHHLNYEVREAKEDLLRIADAFDNVGWAPLDPQNTKEIKLETVKKVAQISRSMYTMNPHVQRGVNARIGYVWGRGVSFDGVDGISEELERNRKKLFNNTAYTELERALATDGNSFTAIPIPGAKDGNEPTVFRVPLDEIFGAVSNPMDVEEVWYFRREYTIRKTNSETGKITEDKVIKYYATTDYYQKLQRLDKKLPRRWKDAGVEQNYVMHHLAVNKQVGWRWGMPDITPVIFWAKAYKEYLEDNANLVKAYSRLAWNIQSANGAGAQAAGAQVLRPPTRDALTGELRDIGGTAITGPGTTATPMPPTGSQVDFDNGSALAAAIASGLQVSKVVITSDPGGGNRATAETLDLPTLKAMEARQQIHTDRFLELFEFWGAKVRPAFNEKVEAQEDDNTGPDYALVTWPQIESDSTKDRVTALGTGVELGVLFKQEARKEALETLGIAPYKPWNELPTMEDDPAAKEKFEQEQLNAEQEFQREQSVIASQGVSGGVSARGGSQTDSNQARNNRKSDSGSK